MYTLYIPNIKFKMQVHLAKEKQSMSICTFSKQGQIQKHVI